ncbi:Cof-type HAD-IIB family hydrolase [Paenibacillus montanisoli]|uniref:Cof-type HAD-IIB family hydrolase n=1 Tax=Paenibacillus montanisoli TaxID=2081970 RepID=A0A328UA00_9BACL|nr:Cof-type HAD-IIB family hydrolase [Paenibacillus montanisoli]
MNYDIIALDVDGTLLTDDHVLTPAVREAVREAHARGAEIVLCTGRGPASALPVLDALGLSGTMITHNGAATIDAAQRKVLHQYSIEATEVERFRSYCLRNGLHFDVNTALDMLIEGITPEAESMYRMFKAKPVMRDPKEPLPDGLVKFTLFGTKADLDIVEAEWNGWTHGLQHIRSGDMFIDVQHKEASKGTALRELAKVRGVDPSRVMAIGNYFNDVGMLAFAGLGVAVANAPDGVKEAADALTRSNEEDGVAHALRTYVFALHEKPSRGL